MVELFTIIIIILILSAVGIALYLYYLNSKMKELTYDVVGYLEKHYGSLTTVIKQEGALFQLPIIVSSRSDIRLNIQGVEYTNNSGLTKKHTEIVMELEREKTRNQTFMIIIKNKISSYYSSQFKQFKGNLLDFKDRGINYRISAKTNNVNEAQQYLIRDIALSKAISRINGLREINLTASRTKLKIVMKVEGIEYYYILNCLYSMRLFIEKEKGKTYLESSKESHYSKTKRPVRTEQYLNKIDEIPNETFVARTSISISEIPNETFVAESLTDKYKSKEYAHLKYTKKEMKEQQVPHEENKVETKTAKSTERIVSSFKFNTNTNLSSKGYNPAYSSVSVLSQGSTQVDMSKLPEETIYRQIRGNIDRIGPVNEAYKITDNEVTIQLYSGLFNLITFNWNLERIKVSSTITTDSVNQLKKALISFKTKESPLKKKDIFLKPYSSIEMSTEPKILQKKLQKKKDIARIFNKLEGNDSQLVIDLSDSVIKVFINTFAHPRNILVINDLLDMLSWFLRYDLNKENYY